VLAETADVLSNQALGPAIWKLTLASPRIAASVQPGQFVHLRLPGLEAHLLRRPFSVFDWDQVEGFIDILYQVAGGGTGGLAALTSGRLDLIGPLGHGWEPPAVKRALLIGGGLGAAPLYGLARALRAGGVAVDLVIGAQTAAALLAVPSFQAVAGADHVHLATDDGSAGHHGFVTAVAERLLAAGGFEYVATCGPQAMQQAVAALAAQAGARCDVSLERRMACGVGACLSCVVKTRLGQARVCAEGPVFDAAEVVW
jgi:dihydroorotate dehydrogenase electron transfer subunit